MSRPEGFLDRWSRLKQDGAPEEDTPAHAAVPEAPPVEDERSDEEILAELGLPDPETLAPGDDVKGFMEAAVPERLRRAALRRLWRANPLLANVDGLVDYGEDFTDSATVVENLQTLYQVGKGMWREPEETAGGTAGETAEKTEPPDEPAAEPAPETVSEPDPEIADDERRPIEPHPPAAAAEEEPLAAAAAPDDADGGDDALVPLRRMAFRFED